LCGSLSNNLPAYWRTLKWLGISIHEYILLEWWKPRRGRKIILECALWDLAEEM
jgi:hypothetical protein